MLFQTIKELLRREDGQGMAEYGLILALVAVALIVALTALKDQLAAVFNSLVTALGGG